MASFSSIPFVGGMADFNSCGAEGLAQVNKFKLDFLQCFTLQLMVNVFIILLATLSNYQQKNIDFHKNQCFHYLSAQVF
jgi:hypothetical protein